MTRILKEGKQNCMVVFHCALFSPSFTVAPGNQKHHQRNGLNSSPAHFPIFFLFFSCVVHFLFFFFSIYFSFFFLPRETNSFSRISMSKFEVWSSFLTFKQTAGDRWSFFITLFSFSGWSLVIPSIGSKNQTNSRWEKEKNGRKKDAASVEVRTRDVWMTNRRYLSIDRSLFDLPLMKTEVHLSSTKYLVFNLTFILVLSFV